MGKYFGTDGVRGEANVELTPELAFKLGRFGGYVLSQHEIGTPKVYVARDTRISGQMLGSSLISGLLSVGIEVYDLGIIATPGVAYLVKKDGVSAGVMISASHNPALDNGIKFFGADGFKLEDSQELEIEALLDAESDTLPRPSAQGLGILHDYAEAVRKYDEFLKNTAEGSFDGFEITLDTANGATYTSARTVFSDLSATINVIGENPDGLNINLGVGSTHPENLAKAVVANGSDLGLAFDGDGDRLIAVDETGAIVDGDKIMFIVAKHLHEKGLLAQDTVVTTVMSNLGFHKALEAAGINSVITAVGDRYVVEEMKKNDYNFGGEQSGHIIFLDNNTTGDGQASAILLVKVMRETGKKLSELAAQVTIYPQKLVNVRVENSMKSKAMEVPAIAEVIAKMEEKMAGNGRILVRPSGTEPLLRVMAEAPTDKEVDDYVDTIVNVVHQEIGID
ncbi:MAG: phosphoglucosamine mutase [Lactococcus raffinolactis]|jgi:phosphoglucosamine mutase|uniref:phosphoglucosamine mutase n=1 Tax=Pseudolactococcus raffinolactis TaxID=1366 RepID=UPI00143688CA|nr:phosphoglucosamine mutase [Lactococcus raffinolactis]MDN5413383.1 phosphoglucosamine mutase [Lactococcus raffinolactis]MDN5414469.1 phosphoglucosamine mutase [Lactococcus raffinolactis]MDN5495202.1 phosphoglucosamine mutase [Lactococcus raffinolactis]MDN5579851.1 phosphoglucosamine mutase [Lactococcus raffinolactis]MDN6036703.1 phosphoglucosamine mutase [Lactococcus raffinolactis]